MLKAEKVRRSQESGAAFTTEDQEINDDLEAFLFENCMTVQEQMYPLMRFWSYLFRHDINSEALCLQDARTEFMRLFESGSSGSRVYSVPNLNKTLVMLTVIDDLFGVNVAGIQERGEKRRLDQLKQSFQRNTQSLQSLR